MLVLAFVCALARTSPQERVEKLISEGGYDAVDVGVLVKVPGHDSAAVSLNSSRGYNPASVMKLVTGAAALDLLGLQYRFATKVYLDGILDKETGTLDGDLCVRGGGDPGFLVERVWLFVQHLYHRGVREIKGDLVLDDSFFDEEISGPGFGEDGSSRAYEAPVGALSANFNTVVVYVAPGATPGSPVHVTQFPRLKGVKVVSTAKTVAAGKSTGLQVKTEKMDGRTAILVYGSMGLDEEPCYKYRKIRSNTWENFGWMVMGLFEQSDISLRGDMRRERLSDSLTRGEPFYTFESQPLAEFLFNMFKYSSNFAAEMLFKTVAAESDSLPGSWRIGAAAFGEWWRRSNLPGTLTVANGSGMGGGNRLEPRQVVALLERAWRDKEALPEFLHALSVAGVDGTLKSRFAKSRLRGIVRAKTGTLNSRGVSNLAGYVLLPGKTYVFAILVNSREQGQFSHWTLQQRILEAVVSQAGKQ